MQATRQNTRRLSALESETLEWDTRGVQWSIVNYGPGTLWFSFTPGVLASPGAPDCTGLRPGFSFTDSQSSPRSVEMSLMAEAGLTYCLDTNQRFGSQATGIPEAPLDGQAYARRNALWEPAAGLAQPFNPVGSWLVVNLRYRTVHFGDQLEFQGVLQRFTADPIGPGAPVLLGTFPLGFRPALDIQYKISLGAAAAGGTSNFHQTALVLQNNGNLSVFVPANTIVFYFNETWPLTLN